MPCTYPINPSSLAMSKNYSVNVPIQSIEIWEILYRQWRGVVHILKVSKVFLIKVAFFVSSTNVHN